VPKLWSRTIESHRQDVRDAILETTARLVDEHGVRAVTMMQIAEETGIGRATLYKYFPDVETILVAWHEGHVSGHLAHVTALRGGAGAPGDRLRAVLEFYAGIQHEHQGTELALMLHRGAHVARARDHLQELLQELLKECAKAGVVRRDIPANELASYCLHALAAARGLRSRAALQRLVGVTMDGLKPPSA
jgi:AcrR family transcriptional regulator